MADLNEKIKAFPDTDRGKHILFWLSLAAVSVTVVSTLRSLSKGRTV